MKPPAAGADGAAGAGADVAASVQELVHKAVQQAAAKAAAEAASEQKARLNVIPELSGATQEELLRGGAVCLVYLRDGPLLAAEELMLTELKKRFDPKVQDSGPELRWMWLDLRAERKLKDVFDPPALPSAILLEPGRGGGGAGAAAGRPRYVAVTHPEEDGDPMPANADAIALLLNSMLGGDAVFRPLPPQRLTSLWVKRTS